MPPLRDQADALLHAMYGPAAAFRDGQWDAIHALAGERKRVLLVQRTGWGKSAVYFIAAKLIRAAGGGPALVVSPLLSLMRDQVRAAERAGVHAVAIHSANREAWAAAEADLLADRCDLLLISPERLANPQFQAGVLQLVGGRLGLLVIDEAHCISDWGHDFRPDYLRVRRVLERLPRGVPVAATTATANDRVTADVASQLGADLLLLRGPLARSSLRLQALAMSEPAARLAWLAQHLPALLKLGSGIVYCLTVADCERVAGFLRTRGIDAKPYFGGLDPERREALEAALRENKLPVLVATVALGMGFDKPDLAWVVHYQRPGSAVAYYQQVGRAGRAVEKAYGVLLSGAEDDSILDHFIDGAFPPDRVFDAVLNALAEESPLSPRDLTGRVDASFGTVEQAAKLLEVAGVVARAGDGGKLETTGAAWRPERDRFDRVTALRRAERDQMRDYVTTPGCKMQFLANALDDPDAGPCGRCAACAGKGFPAAVRDDLRAAAETFLGAEPFGIEPRAMWPPGVFATGAKKIPDAERCEPGRALCRYGDGRWGRFVQRGKQEAEAFTDDLVTAAADLIARWRPAPAPAWVSAVPSSRHPDLVPRFAERLAARLGLPFVAALAVKQPRPEQRAFHNGTYRAKNALAALAAVPKSVRAGPCLLVDDVIDTGWTLTVAGTLLRKAGCSAVLPFALAQSTGKG